MFMAKEELFHSELFAKYLDGLGAFPVHRGQLDIKAIRWSQQILADGWALVTFPEGTRSSNAQLQAGFSGPALIAVHSGVPVLPIGVSGTEKIRGLNWLLQRPWITVNVGQPFYLPPISGRLTREELAELTDYIMEHIAALLPLKYRGDYGGKESR
jgi:1-acyl-sn-glycerol-3-phosphate acyltransferase